MPCIPCSFELRRPRLRPRLPRVVQDVVLNLMRLTVARPDEMQILSDRTSIHMDEAMLWQSKKSHRRTKRGQCNTRYRSLFETLEPRVVFFIG